MHLQQLHGPNISLGARERTEQEAFEDQRKAPHEQCIRVSQNSGSCYLIRVYFRPLLCHVLFAAGGIAPEPRYGHVAWMIGPKMCVFGGVARETEAESRLFRGDGKRR